MFDGIEILNTEEKNFLDIFIEGCSVEYVK